MINDNKDYKILPFNVCPDVFIEFKMEFPNSKYGFDISQISATETDFTKIMKIMSAIAEETIKNFKEEWMISDPDIYLGKSNYESNGAEAGFKMLMKRIGELNDKS
jgi:hypothetical protein